MFLLRLRQGMRHLVVISGTSRQEASPSPLTTVHTLVRRSGDGLGGSYVPTTKIPELATVCITTFQHTTVTRTAPFRMRADKLGADDGSLSGALMSRRPGRSTHLCSAE